MSYNGRNPQDLVNSYMQLRSIPAVLGVAFTVASLYQFGGISTVDLVWLNYTLTETHAMLVSLATYAAAFASSETKQFENYEKWEQALIAAGPVIMVGHQHVGFIADMIATEGNSGPIMAFVVSLIGYGVAVGK